MGWIKWYWCRRWLVIVNWLPTSFQSLSGESWSGFATVVYCKVFNPSNLSLKYVRKKDHFNFHITWNYLLKFLKINILNLVINSWNKLDLEMFSLNNNDSNLFLEESSLMFWFCSREWMLPIRTNVILVSANRKSIKNEWIGKWNTNKGWYVSFLWNPTTVASIYTVVDICKALRKQYPKVSKSHIKFQKITFSNIQRQLPNLSAIFELHP